MNDNRALTSAGTIEPCKQCGAMPFYRVNGGADKAAYIACNCGMQTRVCDNLAAALAIWNAAAALAVAKEEA